MFFNCYLILVFVTILHLQPTEEVSINEFLTLTHSQKVKLDEFRSLVSSRLPQDWMRKDDYLIRWLRDRNFDVEAAKEKILANVAWRKDNDIDSILKEDWSDFDAEYKTNVEGCDKEGKPVLSIIIGSWDIRRAVLAGKGDRLNRYFDRLLEQCLQMIIQMQNNGQTVTQFTLLYEMGNFNLVQQGCAACIPIYIYLLRSVEAHYPWLVHKLIVVNVPQFSLPIWDLYKGLLSQQTQEMLVIFGRDKKTWSDAIGMEIESSQLSRTFGGEKEEALDAQEWRESGEVMQCQNIKEDTKSEPK